MIGAAPGGLGLAAQVAMMNDFLRTFAAVDFTGPPAPDGPAGSPEQPASAQPAVAAGALAPGRDGARSAAPPASPDPAATPRPVDPSRSLAGLRAPAPDGHIPRRDGPPPPGNARAAAPGAGAPSRPSQADAGREAPAPGPAAPAAPSAPPDGPSPTPLGPGLAPPERLAATPLEPGLDGATGAPAEAPVGGADPGQADVTQPPAPAGQHAAGAVPAAVAGGIPGAAALLPDAGAARSGDDVPPARPDAPAAARPVEAVQPRTGVAERVPASPAGRGGPERARDDVGREDIERDDVGRVAHPSAEAAPAVGHRPEVPSLPVVRHEAAADIDLRFLAEGASAAGGGSAAGAAVLIFNAAMIPGWPPPRPFAMPEAGAMLAALFDSPQLRGGEEELAGRVGERAGLPALAGRLRMQLRRLPRSRRLRALLGLAALMDTIGCVLEAVEAELLELSRARREDDWAEAGTRRQLTA